ncbi:proline iminopeptidase [Oceanobacillus limi]|uniref:Proline iminopeptidase n=1 Tax=Oceanobacillus limi TaxID=930131 RepID=A0A1H9Y2X6_9BACI|nr:alpha/beta hydrolase [Oceanobacillus limi]SES63157.1 proline iminopeptidase [Oceanobacillus limi]
MKFQTSDGIELFYEKSGQGVPCVYLHGGPGYWSKSFQFYAQELLEDNFEMVYLDQRGCGRSNHSETRSYSLTRLLDDLEELRISLGINEWCVMGHSFGGILAVNYANRFPERTKGIILSNATLHMYDSFSHQIHKGMDVLNMERETLQRDNLTSFMETFYSILGQLMEKQAYFTFQYMDRNHKAAVDELDEGLDSDPAFQEYVFSSEEYFQDFTSLTKTITKPVLVIAGEFDDAVGPNHHKAFEFPNRQVCLLKGSHHPYIENRQAFKKAVLNFISHITGSNSPSNW